jgi:hypothetical protein
MTQVEVSREIIAPFLRAVARDLDRRPLAKGERRTYPNPLGRDMLPFTVVERADPPLADYFRKLADFLEHRRKRTRAEGRVEPTPKP